MVAKKEAEPKPDGTLVVSPTGAETYVPDTILGLLLESGYTKK